MIKGLCAWAVLAATYLLLVGDTSATELVAALLCGGLAAAWWWAIGQVSSHAFRFEAAGLAASGRAVAGLPGATARVGILLLRALTATVAGSTRERRFTHGRREDPRAAGRRAVGILAASLAPDSYILRAPEQRDMIQIHALAGTAGRDDPLWPI